jgi:hypothetical protein
MERNGRREENIKRKRDILEKYKLSASNIMEHNITWGAEASSGVWVPRAGLGHLVIDSCNL